MTTCASAIDVGAPNADLPQVLDRFRCVFNQLDKGNLHKLQEVYGEDIQFQDPFGQIKGLDQLTEYMAAAYGNVIRCQFRFDEPVEQNGWCALPWVMELQHKRIRGGSPLYVNGISHLEIRDGKVRYHRLPVVGRLVRWVKERAG